jgi:hypothetical protein
MASAHRVLLGVVLLGNVVAFAGVDPITRALTAALVVLMVADAKRIPRLPGLYRWCAISFAALVVLQLAPLPEPVRRLLQPGFAGVLPAGWTPLSLAPWSTVQVAVSVVLAAGVALTAARMASARSGLPALVALLAAACGLLAVLGFAAEAGGTLKVLLVRDNTGGGSPYGPFVNHNHFAQAIELTVPAGFVLAAAGVRNLGARGGARQRSVMLLIAGAATAAVGCGAVLRAGSKGGVLFLTVAGIVTLPLWTRPRRRLRWGWVAAPLAVVAVAVVLAATRLGAVHDQLGSLLVVEGIEGNTRWDLWMGTVHSWLRAPLLGSGLGSYRHVIGLDKPATSSSVLAQAHNDWLEWLSTAGAAGFGILVVAVVGLAVALGSRRLRSLRHEYRYPLAGAAFALVATALHELVDFGLQIPLNRYLLAAWLGLVWGIAARVEISREAIEGEGA